MTDAPVPETSLPDSSNFSPSSDEPLAIILAAGKGTRMKSELPKVLCPVLGQPMVDFVLAALDRAGVKRKVVVVGYRADLVRETLADRPGVEFAEQTEQLGTGHAVMMCRDQLREHHGPVVIVAGDSPMLQTSSLRRLLEEFADSRPACLLGTLLAEDPSGLGRIVRNDQGEFLGIVEEKDATPAQQAIREVNMSTYVFESQELLKALDQLTNFNRQQEYYLTDCPGILRASGKQVRALAALEPCEALSINTIEQLAAVEDALRNREAP